MANNCIKLRARTLYGSLESVDESCDDETDPGPDPGLGCSVGSNT